MAKKSKRIIPGLITLVGTNLRIVNGNVDSLKKMRKPGRPKKLENLTMKRWIPVFPGRDELRESSVRDGFHLVRHRSRRDLITKNNRSLQAKFDSLCSEVKIVDPYSWEHAAITARLTSGKISRIERSVPHSFCSCAKTTDEDEQVSCLAHGLKRPDCACGGINGITGYRMCAGHRTTGHVVGIAPFVTDRMRSSKEHADKASRDVGWM